MKRTFTGKVVADERMNNSINGNPKYRLTYLLKDGSYITGQTATDASIGYSCLNNKGTDKTIQYHETRSGKIIFDMEV